MNEKNKELIKKLSECICACNTCHDMCLQESDVQSMTECIRLDKDCAAICSTTMNMLYPGSKFAGKMLEFCKCLCKACGDECRKFDMDHCRKCADACDACAKACEETASGM